LTLTIVITTSLHFSLLVTSLSLSLQVNAAVSFQNNLAIESTNTSSQAMTQHRSSVSKQQLSDNYREPSFEVYELSVSDLGIVFHSWKTLNKGGE